MVQRYELKDVSGYPYDPYNDLVKSDEGDWVGYEDYKELDDYYQERLADADKEIEGLVSRLAEVNAELQKYKDQFPDYVECTNCGSVTHVEGVEHNGKESAWVVWSGGENPVPGSRVDVKFRCGVVLYDGISNRYYWRHTDIHQDPDIIAYRVVG
jgi:hypothetical protein